jgi:hypothetical protein
MTSEHSGASRRNRLLIMMAPAILVFAGGVAAYFNALGVPGLDFGKRRLLATTLAAALLVATGVVLHRKAVADLHNLHRAYWKTVLFAVVSVVAGPILLVLALDTAAGVYLRMSQPAPILVLHPDSTESYRTEEFSFTANTNALGIRDGVIGPRRKAEFRVVALGDSFTYGWGADDDATWPKVLERRLADSKRDVAVLNFGCPGAGVDAYAKIAESVIPIHKPRVVLVAVLQGIDLKLLDIGDTTDRLFQAKVDRNGRFSESLVATVCPNLCELRARLAAHRPRVMSADENREEWKANTAWMMKRLSPNELEHFNTLQPKIRRMFFDGDLNPWEVYFALKYPDYVSFTLNPERPEVQKAVNAMAGHLGRIKIAAEAVGARTLVLSVPPAWYVSPAALASKRQVGYHLDNDAIRSNAPDDLIRSACRTAGVEFCSMTARFRGLGLGEKWYFDFDGMYNAKGYSIYGVEAAIALSRFID